MSADSHPGGQLPLFEPRPGIVGRRHPETAHEAAQAVTPRTGTQRRLILDWITRCGPAGATDFEIQQRLGLDGNTERPRRLELEQAGLIVNSGRTRIHKGRRAIVWTATSLEGET